MKCRLLLDVIVAESATILELLACENQPLLIRRDTGWWTGGSVMSKLWRQSTMDSPLLVLDLCFNIIDSVGRLHLEGDRLPREGLDEDLHLDEGSTSSIASLP